MDKNSREPKYLAMRQGCQAHDGAGKRHEELRDESFSTPKRTHVIPAAATYRRLPRVRMCAHNIPSIQKLSRVNFGTATTSP